MQRGNSLGLGEKLAGSLGQSSSRSVFSNLEPLQLLQQQPLGQLTALHCWWVATGGERELEPWRGGPAR